MRYFVFLLLAGLISGCASGPIKNYKPASIAVAKGPQTATVFMNRSSTSALSSTAGKIKLNGETIGTIKNGQCVKLTVPAGSHNLSVVAGFDLGGAALAHSLLSSLELYALKIKPGETKFFSVRPEFDLNSGWRLRYHARAIWPDLLGLQQIASLQIIDQATGPFPSR